MVALLNAKSFWFTCIIGNISGLPAYPTYDKIKVELSSILERFVSDATPSVLFQFFKVSLEC